MLHRPLRRGLKPAPPPTWQEAWHALANHLPLDGVRALALALTPPGDARLTRVADVIPSALHAPPLHADPLALACWIGMRLTTVGQVAGAVDRVRRQAGPVMYSTFVGWWEWRGRGWEQACAELLAEVRVYLAEVEPR